MLAVVGVIITGVSNYYFFKYDVSPMICVVITTVGIIMIIFGVAPYIILPCIQIIP
jgi:hypothetical protein